MASVKKEITKTITKVVVGKEQKTNSQQFEQFNKQVKKSNLSNNNILLRNNIENKNKTSSKNVKPRNNVENKKSTTNIKDKKITIKVEDGKTTKNIEKLITNIEKTKPAINIKKTKPASNIKEERTINRVEDIKVKQNPVAKVKNSSINTAGIHRPKPLNASGNKASHSGKSRKHHSFNSDLRYDYINASHTKVIFISAWAYILFFLPLITFKHDKFARYHANQGLLVLLFTLLCYGISVGLYFAWAPLGIILVPIVFLCSLVYITMGICNASDGKAEPLPLLGKITIIKSI